MTKSATLSDFTLIHKNCGGEAKIVHVLSTSSVCGDSEQFITIKCGFCNEIYVIQLRPGVY